MARYTAAMLVGSFREQSINMRLARAIERYAPDTIGFVYVPINEMPFYCGDLEGDRPASVRGFVETLAGVDGVCVVTPEYNRSIPGVLKNAIDWSSKPADKNVWNGTPVAMTGASPGAIGTAVAQQHLRQVLSILGATVLPGEVYITFKGPEMIAADGTIGDESVRGFITAFAARFAALVEKTA